MVWALIPSTAKRSKNQTAKGPEDNKPILIVSSDREAISRFIAEPTATFDLLAKRFWPGPLSWIRQSGAKCSGGDRRGSQRRLGFDYRATEKFAYCSTVGRCLTATSANPSQQEAATSAQKVFSYFGNAIDLIVDGGEVERISRQRWLMFVTLSRS